MTELPLIDCCRPLDTSTLSGEEAEATAALFASLSDPARVKIVNLLATNEEPVCACEFQPLLGIRQPTVSHHLKQLVEAGLLEREKRGTFAYYSLKPGALERMGALLAEPSVSIPA